MTLSIRPRVYSLPSYSLTGDLLGFLRCGLQYRYQRIGKLPASRPVQQWFGEFVHGVLEESFRRHRDAAQKATPRPPPWPAAELDDIFRLIKARLGARGLHASSAELEELGDARATAAVQELGPHLFPLIHRAEVRLTGARVLPAIPPQLQFRVADRYEMVGVVDVVSHLELGDPAHAANPVVGAILAVLGSGLPDQFEVIIDYKGMRRPPVPRKGAGGGSLWDQYAWQVQTYGELRRVQLDARTVVAGVLLYVNELHPTRGDIERLQDEIARGETDMPPPKGSDDAEALRTWRKRDRDLPQLSLGYRLARALRVIPITPASIAEALDAFDGVVASIETCRGQELQGTSVINAWTKNASERSTCEACDFRTYCPEFRRVNGGRASAPSLPSVKP